MRLSSFWSKFYMFFIFVLLYAPIAVMVVFSFNAGNSTAVFSGFSLRWYESLFRDRAILNSLYNTVILAFLSAIISTVLGTAAAVGINYLSKWQRKIVDSITNIPMMNPDIVTGVSLLLLFVFVGRNFFGNSAVLGFWTVLISHITFNLPYVILSVQPALRGCDTHLSEAARDLGCTPVGAFFRVILPAISPGILTGFIMAFTLSIDDFVITYFTSGNAFETLPMKIYNMTKVKVKPDINALSTIMVVTILLLLVLINIFEARSNKKKRR